MVTLQSPHVNFTVSITVVGHMLLQSTEILALSSGLMVITQGVGTNWLVLAELELASQSGRSRAS